MKAETVRLRTAKFPDISEIILALGRALSIVDLCHGITVMVRLGCCLSTCARGSGLGSRMFGSQARRAKSCGRGICSSVAVAGRSHQSGGPAVGRQRGQRWPSQRRWWGRLRPTIRWRRESRRWRRFWLGLGLGPGLGTKRFGRRWEWIPYWRRHWLGCGLGSCRVQRMSGCASVVGWAGRWFLRRAIRVRPLFLWGRRRGLKRKRQESHSLVRRASC